MPTLYVIAGPNGAGKSTLSGKLRVARGLDIIDPDQGSSNPFTAGRLAVLRFEELVARGMDFGIETTLSIHGTLRRIERLRAAKWRVHFTFVTLLTPIFAFCALPNAGRREAMASRSATSVGVTIERIRTQPARAEAQIQSCCSITALVLTCPSCRYLGVRARSILHPFRAGLCPYSTPCM